MKQGTLDPEISNSDTVTSTQRLETAKDKRVLLWHWEPEQWRKNCPIKMTSLQGK